MLAPGGGTRAHSLAKKHSGVIWAKVAPFRQVLVELQTDPRQLALDEGANRIALTRHGNPTMLFDLETGASLGEAPHSLSRPVVGPDGALFGAGESGVWRNLDGETTVLAADLDDCSSVAATPKWIAAMCHGDEQQLHVWAGDEHTSVPAAGRAYGRTLHAWPDANHIYFVGGQEQLVRRSDSGALEVLESPRLLGETERFLFPAASSNGAHDLVVHKSGGVFSLWNTSDEPVPLLETETRALAISGDGLHIAYSPDHLQIIVRDRALSKARPALSAALEASSEAAGEH